VIVVHVNCSNPPETTLSRAVTGGRNRERNLLNQGLQGSFAAPDTKRHAMLRQKEAQR